MSDVEALLGSMTLAEKLGQLTMTAAGSTVTGPVLAGASVEEIRDGSIGNLFNLMQREQWRDLQRVAVEQTRLGIPLLLGLDVIHGYRTLFPVPLAEAGLFDPTVWELTAREAAREAAADGIAMVFAPMVDVARDPRWGRMVEGAGEDAWLAARVAEAKVRGFQGGDLGAADAVAAVVKHYCAYGAVTAGREYASADVSERALEEIYLPPFDAAIAAGVAALMPAFIDVNGVPMTAHLSLLRERLRQRLGFEGVIVSDYNAIAELMRHGVAADLAAAAALALNAGVDIDMMANAYRHGLPIALERGAVSLTQIDAAVRRVLRLKQRLGLFEDPYRRGAATESAATLVRRRALARTTGARSLLLLHNEAELLPLPSTVQSVAVIGPLADAPAEMRGSWWCAGEPAETVSVLAGLRTALPSARVLYVEGVPLERTSAAATSSAPTAESIATALELIEQCEVVLLCLGEAANEAGEAASRAHPVLPGRQRELAEAVLERARARDKPVIALLFSGRPLIVPWLIGRARAVLAAWFPGSEAGHAVADVLTGRVSPCGRSPVSWPRALGQVPIYFSQRPSGRPADPVDHYTSKYLDEANEPLFPFGHGLSYGRFTLSNLRLGAASVAEGDDIELWVDVLNGGEHAAEETVFLFARDPLASVARPLLELRGFARIQLPAGAGGTVHLQLPASELRFLDAQLHPVFEPGEIELLVGPSADRARLLSVSIQLRGP
jgi:beta-glucosidase